MSFGPVVTGTRLSEYKVVRAEYLSERSRADRVHGSRLKIDEDSPGNIFATSGFVVVDVYPFQLQIGVSVVCSGRIDSMFVGNNLPELGSDLVSALSGLEMDDFTHVDGCRNEAWKLARKILLVVVVQTFSCE